LTGNYLRFLLCRPFGQIRTCFADGISRAGEIDGYDVVPAGEFRFEDLRFGAW
jgi:hypothetical protein